MYTWILVFFTVFLKNRNIISKIKSYRLCSFKVTYTGIKYLDSCSKELGLHPTMFILESIFHKCERVLWRFLRAYISPTQNHAYEPFLVSLIVLLKQTFYKNSKWVWSGNTTITNCRQTHGTARQSHTTITRHQEGKLSKAAKLEWA